jgi:hypothetical protein
MRLSDCLVLDANAPAKTLAVDGSDARSGDDGRDVVGFRFGRETYLRLREVLDGGPEE